MELLLSSGEAKIKEVVVNTKSHGKLFIVPQLNTNWNKANDDTSRN